MCNCPNNGEVTFHYKHCTVSETCLFSLIISEDRHVLHHTQQYMLRKHGKSQIYTIVQKRPNKSNVHEQAPT